MAFIIMLIIIALVLVFLVSRFVTVEQIGLADKEGVLSQFDDSYAETDTFRSLGMANWTAWDMFMWIIKSGNYEPGQA